MCVSCVMEHFVALLYRLLAIQPYATTLFLDTCMFSSDAFHILTDTRNLV